MYTKEDFELAFQLAKVGEPFVAHNPDYWGEDRVYAESHCYKVTDSTAWWASSYRKAKSECDGEGWVPHKNSFSPLMDTPVFHRSLIDESFLWE